MFDPDYLKYLPGIKKILEKVVLHQAWWKKYGLPAPSKSDKVIMYKEANTELPSILRCFLDKVREDIWFVGTSFYITLPDNGKAIFEKLEGGVKIRFLIYDHLRPKAEVEEIAAGFNQKFEQLYSECEITVSNLRLIVNKWEQYIKTEGNKFDDGIEVRLFKDIPRTRFYIFDRRNDDGLTFFVPYVFGMNTPNLPGYLTRNVSSSVKAYLSGLDRLWENSVSLQEWDRLKKQKEEDSQGGDLAS